MLKTNDLNEIPEFGPVFMLTDDVTFRIVLICVELVAGILETRQQVWVER